MRRTLSSAQTFLMKFIFPSLWLVGFATATVVLFTTGGGGDAPRSPPLAELKWFFLAATVLGGAFLYWGCMRLKRVEIDDQWVYISNFVRETRVPLRDIEDVSENRWINIRPVTIGFRRDTEFGPRVTFMPKTRFRGFWQAHPVVGELEGAVRAVRGLPPERPAA